MAVTKKADNLFIFYLVINEAVLGVCGCVLDVLLLGKVILNDIIITGS